MKTSNQENKNEWKDCQIMITYHKDHFPDPGYLVKYSNGDIEFIKQADYKSRKVK